MNAENREGMGMTFDELIQLLTTAEYGKFGEVANAILDDRSLAVKKAREEIVKLAESLLHDDYKNHPPRDLERSIGHNMAIHCLVDAIRSLLSPTPAPEAAGCKHEWRDGYYEETKDKQRCHNCHQWRTKP
jgi:hypothetical protein